MIHLNEKSLKISISLAPHCQPRDFTSWLLDGIGTTDFGLKVNWTIEF